TIRDRGLAAQVLGRISAYLTIVTDRAETSICDREKSSRRIARNPAFIERRDRPVAILLAGWPPALRLLEPIALATVGEHRREVQEAVEDGGSDHLVAQELAPGVEAAVGGQDHRAGRVAAGEELTEGAAGGVSELEVSDLV